MTWFVTKKTKGGYAAIEIDGDYPVIQVMAEDEEDQVYRKITDEEESHKFVKTGEMIYKISIGRSGEEVYVPSLFYETKEARDADIRELAELLDVV